MSTTKKRLRAKVTINGEPVYVSASTKRELEEKKVKARQDLELGVYGRKDIPFNEAIQLWWDNVRAPRFNSANTMRNYKRDLVYIQSKTDKRKMLKAVSRADLQAIVDSRAGYCVTHISRLRVLLQWFFKYALSEGMVDRDPSVMLEMPSDVRKFQAKRALTKDERAKIMEAMDDPSIGLSIAFLFFTGCRCGEMLALQWEDIDFASRTIHIHRSQGFYEATDGKTSAADRTIPIPAPLLERFGSNRGMPGVRVFTKRNGKQFDWGAEYDAMFKRAMAKVGLDGITPHYLRHNYITMCWEAGIDSSKVTKIVGHSSYAITLAVYTHLSEEYGQKVVDEIDEMFKGCQKVATR